PLPPQAPRSRRLAPVEGAPSLCLRFFDTAGGCSVLVTEFVADTEPALSAAEGAGTLTQGLQSNTGGGPSNGLCPVPSARPTPPPPRNLVKPLFSLFSA